MFQHLGTLSPKIFYRYHFQNLCPLIIRSSDQSHTRRHSCCKLQLAAIRCTISNTDVKIQRLMPVPTSAAMADQSVGDMHGADLAVGVLDPRQCDY